MTSKLLSVLANEAFRITQICDGCHVQKDPDASRWHWYAEGVRRAHELVRGLIPRPEVERFAMGMERKLRQNDHKGGWKQMSVDEMIERLDEEVEELKKALHPMRKDNPQRVFKEAVDIANFCMFIADNAGALKDDE
jgi:hypothetical protein